MDDFSRWLKRGDVVTRIAAIRRRAGPGYLGWTQLMVTSWEQDWLYEWERSPESLTQWDYQKLIDIENRVFGYGMRHA